MNDPIRELREIRKIVDNTEGAIGYILAWLLGVPASLLVVIWALRGFD